MTTLDSGLLFRAILYSHVSCASRVIHMRDDAVAPIFTYYSPLSLLHCHSTIELLLVVRA